MIENCSDKEREDIDMVDLAGIDLEELIKSIETAVGQLTELQYSCNGVHYVCKTLSGDEDIQPAIYKDYGSDNRPPDNRPNIIKELEHLLWCLQNVRNRASKVQTICTSVAKTLVSKRGKWYR